jgi:spermidine/putrescine transport system permease protein
MAAQGASRSGLRSALPLLAPAYLWLTVAIFLPLSAMVFFSFMTELPLSESRGRFTFGLCRLLLAEPLSDTAARVAAPRPRVTLWCIVIGYPAAYVLAKVLKGRSREAIFLLVILPFWSNGLVRIFSWAMVLREGGILDTALNAMLPFKINIDLMYSYPAVIIGLVHSYVPYMVLTCYLTLQAIDDSLIEAGRSLGASRLQVLKRVIIPLSMPGLVAGAALIFVPVVGSFMEPRILGDDTGTLRHGHRGPVRRRVQLAAGCRAVLHPAGCGAGHPGGCIAGAAEGRLMATRILNGSAASISDCCLPSSICRSSSWR